MTSRAVAALRQIMLDDDDETMSPRRRIAACEQMLDFEAPAEIVEEAKTVLMALAEDKETFVDIRLDALKLLRRAVRKDEVAGATVKIGDAISFVKISSFCPTERTKLRLEAF
jgi:hypothetical protein